MFELRYVVGVVVGLIDGGGGWMNLYFPIAPGRWVASVLSMADSKKQATWGGRFRAGPDPRMVVFSESVSVDKRLAPFDIQGSQAHARMLAKVGLIETSEAEAICSGLDGILGEIQAGTFTWDIALEDVHMNVEQALRARVPAAAKLHTARSRNDQVATAMRLFFRDAADALEAEIEKVLSVLLDQAEATREIIIPGYTHLQRAQPVSMAHHFLAYVEMFGRDRERFQALRGGADSCPLGAGALAGTALPIDRAYTAKLLGFVDSSGVPQMTRNSLDAVADRDLFIEFASACALCGVHLSRVAEDLILWNSSEFGFITFPDGFTTGSSLMPQKKNPDALELIRGKSARMHGALSMLITLCKGLPLTYNRDLQEDKPPVFDCLDTTLACLDIFAGTLQGARPNTDRCAAAVADPLLLATDVADYLVRKGMPFREAHHVVGALVALAEDERTPLNQLSDVCVAAISPLLEPDWKECFDLKKALAAREKVGMPGPQAVESEIARWRKILS